MNIDIHYHGPMFDGRAQAALLEGIQATQEYVADVGKDMVQAELQRVTKTETPYYRTQIATKSVAGRGFRADNSDSFSTTVIHDNGVVYGPWLEGVGSRNKTTRFKGYWTFRRMTTTLNRAAKTLAEFKMQPYIRRMQ